MAKSNPSTAEAIGDEIGLRGRKKARRRQEILRSAKRLFAENGVDATTLAEIAQETGVSPPTVANYFGSKENILSALIFEGTERARSDHMKAPRATGRDFARIIGNLMCELTENTMKIAGKRVWRYAEAANIRRPNTDFQRQFEQSDSKTLDLIVRLLESYDMVLRSGEKADPRFLAKLFFDRWTTLYFAYIKDDAMTLDSHLAQVRADIRAMVALLFDETFIAASPLKQKKAAG